MDEQKAKFARGTIPEILAPTDLYERAAFIEILDEHQIELERAIAPYTFRDKIRCGLKGCRTPHNKGVLVRTTDGRETNIGHICGSNHFGDFEQLRATLRREVAMERARTTLDNMLARRVQIEERLEQLIEGERGARWVERRKAAFRDTFPDEIVREVQHRAVRGEAAIYRERSRRTDELEALREVGMNASPIEHERVATLRGLAAWDASAGHLHKTIRSTLDDISELDRNTTNYKLLNNLAKRANEIDDAFDHLEDFIRAGRSFFTEENFEVLPSLTDDVKIRRCLNELRWDHSAL